AGGELLGDAFLVRGGAAGFRAGPLPGTDPRQSAVLRVEWNGDTLPVHLTRLGQDPAERARQVRALLARVEPGRAVVLGDFNAEGSDPELVPLAQAGFRDAAALADASPDPTFPASDPLRRIDWIWVRDLAVLRWEVLDEHASDHRPVTALLAPR
ncbi:MAG TPA: endonuclease/exonuclease/phosphatase family protein, partial [Longimicrobiales bacterium]|nr:endonuclease/exonuclease/phosphatase family protein [Longimicrobiales bacterium]